MKCAENFCKDCLDHIPEKEREAIIHNLGKFSQALGKGLETCCHSHCNCNEIKDNL